jgi:hypothetical protein
MAVRWFYWKEEGLLGGGAKRRARGFWKEGGTKGGFCP